MCYNPWDETTIRMGELMLGLLEEVERGRYVKMNRWKADNFMKAISDKYDDEYEFDVADLEEEIEHLRKLAEEDPRWFTAA